MKGWGFSHVSRSNCWHWQQFLGSDPSCKVPSGHSSGVVTVLCKGTFLIDTIKPFSVTAWVPGKLTCQGWSLSTPCLLWLQVKCSPRSPQTSVHDCWRTSQGLWCLQVSPLLHICPPKPQCTHRCFPFPSIEAAQTPSSQSPCQALSSGQAPRTFPPAHKPLSHPATLQAELCCLLPAPALQGLAVLHPPQSFSCHGQLQKSRTELGSCLQAGSLLCLPLPPPPSTTPLVSAPGISFSKAQRSHFDHHHYIRSSSPQQGRVGAHGWLQAVLSSTSNLSGSPGSPLL